MPLPDLTATLTAKTDGFEASLQRAAKASEDASKRIQESTDRIGGGFGILKGAIEAALAGLTINAFAGLIKGAIDAADHLNDLSKKTGIAVETLGGFGFAAEQAGGNLDSVSKGLVKLNVTIAQAGAGNKQAKADFDALGISLKDAAGQTKSADKVFFELADKFAGYEDGANKTALAIRLFGKAGADLIPILDEGGKKLQENVEYFKRYSGVTDDLAQKADAFNDTLAKLSLLQGAFGKQLAGELLPTLQTLANLFVESKEKGTVFSSFIEGLGLLFNKLVGFGADVAFILDRVGNTIGGFTAQLERLIHLDFKSIANIQAEIKLDDKAAREKLDRFKFDLEHAAAFSKATLSGGTFDQEGTSKVGVGKTQAPNPPKTGRTGGAGAQVDINKKLLDQQLKDLDIFIGQEKEKLSDRNTTLALLYGNDQLSITDYFAARKTALDQEVNNTIDAYQREIAATNDYIATQNAADPKGQAKIIDAKTKILDITEKLRKVEHDASLANLKDSFAQEQALQRYSDGLAQLAAQVKAIGGNSTDLFATNFDSQNRGRVRQLQATASSGSSTDADKAAAQQALDNLQRLRDQGVVEAQLTDLEKQRSKVLLEVSNAQNRVSNAVSAGRLTELEGLQKLSDVNKARLADLQRIIDAEQAVAEKSGDPEALARVDALRVEYEKLADQTDLVADKFRALGESATENFINKLVDGTATVKDAFKGLVRDITSELLKIGNKEISQQLFKKDGALGSLFSKFGASANDSPSSAFANDDGSNARDQLLGRVGTTAAAADAVGKAGDTAGAAASSTAFAAAIDAAGVAFGAAIDTAGIAFGTGADTAALAFGTGVDTAGIAFGTAVGTAGTAFATAITAAGTAFAASVSASGAGSSIGGIAGAVGSASAKGNIFVNGNVIPFARGGVINSPTIFPMSNGQSALTGEAGPEAIMPLRRGANGALGVAVTGGGQQQRSFVVNNNFTVAGSVDRRSQAQIAAAASSGLQRAASRAT